MPEAVSESLPTAGTVPHTDDDCSPDLIQIPWPYPHGCSTVLLLERVTPVAVCFTVVGRLFSVALEIIVGHPRFVFGLSAVAFFFFFLKLRLFPCIADGSSGGLCLLRFFGSLRSKGRFPSQPVRRQCSILVIETPVSRPPEAKLVKMIVTFFFF